MKMKCYIHGCKNESKDVHFLFYLLCCIVSWSLKPYVCKDHRDLFNLDGDISDLDGDISDLDGEKITSIWIDCDFAECPACGDMGEVLAMPNGDYFDGSPLRCCGCRLRGWVSADEGGTWDNWEGY